MRPECPSPSASLSQGEQVINPSNGSRPIHTTEAVVTHHHHPPPPRDTQPTIDTKYLENQYPIIQMVQMMQVQRQIVHQVRSF